MEFLSDILRAAGADTARAVTILPGFGACFRGVTEVASFSAEKIVLRAGGAQIAVEGENLGVGKLFAGDLFVSGRVSEVRFG